MGGRGSKGKIAVKGGTKLAKKIINFEAVNNARKTIKDASKKISSLNGVVNRYKQQIKKMVHPANYDQDFKIKNPYQYEKLRNEFYEKRAIINNKIEATERKIASYQNTIKDLSKKYGFGYQPSLF